MPVSRPVFGGLGLGHVSLGPDLSRIGLAISIPKATQRATIPMKVEILNAMNSHLYRLHGAACTQLH
jgi:hypothetical protein